MFLPMVSLAAFGAVLFRFAGTAFERFPGNFATAVATSLVGDLFQDGIRGKVAGRERRRHFDRMTSDDTLRMIGC